MGKKAMEEGHPQSGSARYEREIDLQSTSTHARIVRLVPANSRVLELGCSTGFMSRVFALRDCKVTGIELDKDAARMAEQFCERVIVGDLDLLDLDEILGEETFDVVVAADVLEHLKTADSVLRTLRPHLRPEGSFVASLPNIAHGSVRLALLAGDFVYTDSGLLDRTHLRFFTRRTIESLFEEAGYVIGHLERNDNGLADTEVAVDLSKFAPELIQSLRNDRDALTYQFVLKAFPLSFPGMAFLQERFRVGAEEQASMQLENERLQRALHQREEELVALRIQVDKMSVESSAEERELLSQEISGLQEHALKLQTALQGETARADSAENQLHEKSAEWLSRAAQLTRAAHEYEKSRQELEQQIGHLRLQVEQLAGNNSELESVREEVLALRGRQQSSDLDSERLRDELEASHRRAQVLQQRINTLQAQGDALRSELEAIHNSRLWRMGAAYWRTLRILQWK